MLAPLPVPARAIAPPSPSPSPGSETPATKVSQSASEKAKALNEAQVDTRTPDLLNFQLLAASFSKPPPIHAYPAPPAVPSNGDPALVHAEVPSEFILEKRRRLSRIGSFLNSTAGRTTLFLTTILLFNLGLFGLVGHGDPEFVKNGESSYYFCLYLGITLTMYTIPLLGERAGMKSTETGWKPYLAMYRCAFLLAIFAIVLTVLGTGQKNWNGTKAGSNLKITNLKNKYWNWFELADGFVALNLTKGVTETLAAEEHGITGFRRKSRFRDTQLRVNKEPFSDMPEPTETPGSLAQYVVAPIFESWAYCATRYRISANCLTQNPVRAWAVARSSSLCSRARSVACRPPKPLLKPVYRCTKDGGTQGELAKAPISGICGRVTLPPPEGAIDELGALMIYDAWPQNTLPKKSDLWIDVSPDECIADPQICDDAWSLLGLVGLIFQILTNLCLVMTMIQDCRVDRKIRAAYEFMEEQDRLKKKIEASRRKNKA